MENPAIEIVSALHVDCFYLAIAHDAIKGVFESCFPENTVTVPDMRDVYKVAKAYDHWSFTSSLDKYREAHNVFNACVDVARMALEMSFVYKKRAHHFDAIEAAQVIDISVKDGITRIVLDNGALRIATQNNADFYIAWWHITHPAIEFISKTTDALNKGCDAAEHVYTMVSSILTHTSLTQSAVTLKNSFDCILKVKIA